MLDQRFCDHLEYSLSKALSGSRDPQWRYLWCDGIELETANALSQGRNSVKAKAWIGSRGTTHQEIYEMAIEFGNDSLTFVQANADARQIIPEQLPDDCYQIDIDNKRLTVFFP